jgi:hypothetical protein
MCPAFEIPLTHRVQRPAFCADLLIRQRVGWFPKGPGHVPPPSGNGRDAGARARSSGTGCRGSRGPIPRATAPARVALAVIPPVPDLRRRSGLPGGPAGACLQRGPAQAAGGDGSRRRVNDRANRFLLSALPLQEFNCLSSHQHTPISGFEGNRIALPERGTICIFCSSNIYH